MNEAQYRESLLDLRERFPSIVDVKLEAGKDQTGDPALWVWLILEDKALAGRHKPALDAMEEAARSLIFAKDPQVWAYVRFRTDAEQRQIEVAPTLY